MISNSSNASHSKRSSKQSILAGPGVAFKKINSKSPFEMNDDILVAAQQAQKELFEKIQSQAQKKQQEVKKNLAKLYFSGNTHRKSMCYNYQPIQRTKLQGKSGNRATVNQHVSYEGAG